VSCRDSRIAFEPVLDRGLGDDRTAIDLIGGFYDPETGKVEFYRPLVGAAPTPAPPSAPGRDSLFRRRLRRTSRTG
jgi:hypothetical protein